MRTVALVRLTTRPLRKALNAIAAQWKAQGYTLTFRKGSRFGTLTIEGPGLPQPYHVLARSVAEAQRKAPRVLRQLSKGRTPNFGVYRPLELSPQPMATSYGGVRP